MMHLSTHALAIKKVVGDIISLLTNEVYLHNIQLATTTVGFSLLLTLFRMLSLTVLLHLTQKAYQTRLFSKE